MSSNVQISQIQSVECELSIYRKGCISVYIDLDNSYLTWRESRQWCNNFTRTVAASLIKEFRAFISESALVQTLLDQESADDAVQTICTIPCKYQSEATGNPIYQQDGDEQYPENDDMESHSRINHLSRSSWQIRVKIGRQQFSLSGYLPLPEGWQELQFKIEKMSRSPFRIS